jgi:hypothetical protein
MAVTAFSSASSLSLLGDGRDESSGAGNVTPAAKVLARAVQAARASALVVSLAALGSLPAGAAPVTFSVGGTDAPSSIQATVDAFRAALGNPNNGNVAGPLASGHREINWDGGGPPVDANAAGGTPFNVFLNNRGAQSTTPGTGFVQAPPSGGANGGLAGFFGNATYGNDFGVFSPNRLFTPVGSNVTDEFFFIPGTNGGTPATVIGFGAVFTDVDLANSTTVEFFDEFGDRLASLSVPAGTVADRSLSFLGVVFDAGEQIFRVRITTGTDPLASGTNDNPGGGVDLVAMDDFIFGEPTAVPEPTTLAVLGAGLIGLGAARRRRGGKASKSP